MATPRTTADRFLLPSTVTPSHYALELTPDLQTFDFDGIVDIAVTVNTKEVSTIELHCHEISITKVYFTAADNTVLNMCGVSFDLDLTTVTLSFPSALPVGAGQLHIEYKGILNEDMAGFYRSKYTDVEGNDQYMVSRQYSCYDLN
jgi:aminopeptidase N